MRDNSHKKINIIERGIINLDSNKNNGTYWTAYYKKNNIVEYFDSFGNLKPPTAITKFFQSNGKVTIYYNFDRYQNFNQDNCGHLCLNFLYNTV